MQLAAVSAEALPALLAIDVATADWLSGCRVELARLITSISLALLLLLVGRWRPVRSYFSAISAGDARLVRGVYLGALIFFAGDAWFTLWSLIDCFGGGTGDTGTPVWWPLVPVGVIVAAMWKSGALDGKQPKDEKPLNPPRS